MNPYLIPDRVHDLRRTKPDPTKVQALIDALRSNHYRQARSNLRFDGCYCVMGVAVDVLDPALWVYGKGALGDDFQGLLPLLGMPPQTYLGAWACLYGANDNGATFAELADFLAQVIAP